MSYYSCFVKGWPGLFMEKPISRRFPKQARSQERYDKIGKKPLSCFLKRALKGRLIAELDDVQKGWPLGTEHITELKYLDLVP